MKAAHLKNDPVSNKLLQPSSVNIEHQEEEESIAKYAGTSPSAENTLAGNSAVQSDGQKI